MLYVPSPKELRSRFELVSAREVQEALLLAMHPDGFGIEVSELSYLAWACRFEEAWTSKGWVVVYKAEVLAVSPAP